MKTKYIILLVAFLALRLPAQYVITNYSTTTNFSKVTLTVAKDSTLRANGNPLQFYLSAVDFLLENNVLMLSPAVRSKLTNSPTATTTNTITVYNLTNAWLGSQRITTYTTNYAAWGASNYLGRVAGIYSWRLDGGNDGGNPPMSIPMSLVGSYNGSNGWFVITNGFQTTNTISIAAITNGLSDRGSARVTLGSASLFSVDKWELLGRRNYGFGQDYSFDWPVEDNDPATKGYVDQSIALALNGQMTTYSSTNDGTFHTDLKVNGSRVFGISTKTVYAPVSVSNNITELVIETPATNLVAGYVFTSSTNLALGMVGFSAYTNYVAVTNGAAVDITVPIYPADPQRYFLIQLYSTRSMQFDVPTFFTAGTAYPSNTWNLATITNGMRSGDIITVNSNGLKLVDVWISNSTPVLKPHW